MKIEERIDKLRQEIERPNFLTKKQRGGEIPYWVFDYPAEKELLIRESVDKLVSQLKSKGIVLKNINLYDLALEVIMEKVPFTKIQEYEKKEGSEKLLIKLRTLLNINALNSKIQNQIEENDNVVILTGVGNAWPLIRAHVILNNTQSFIEKPLIVFYPGMWDKNTFQLFGKFKDANYYRAFRLIDYPEEKT